MHKEDHQSPLAISKKRHSINANKRQAYLDEWKKSGLSMSEFCRQHNLSISSFSGWAKQSKAPENLFKSFEVTSPAEGGVIEIIFKNTIKIRFLNSPDMSLVLRVAKELAGCS